MTSKRSLWPILTLIVLFSLALSACAPAAPAPSASDAGAAAPAEATSAPAEEGVVEVAVTPTPVADLEGKIVISFQSNDTQTFEALCAAYEELHPKVDCVTELKPPEGYQEWIRTQFAGGVPAASLVNGNVVADLVLDKQFLDLTSYFDQTSPYTGKPWREDFEESALANMRNPTTGETFLLNTETVQVLWFYNKQAFEEAGILAEAEALAQTDRNQPTWDQLLTWCDALDEAGYIPVAIEGDFRAFWEFRVGWLARMYADQFTRDEAELVRCQEGDWCARPGIDDQWTYDPTDPYNDDATEITFNVVRKMNALKSGEQSVNGPKWRAMYENFKQFADRCTPPGWIGTTDAYPLFLTQKAAIRLDGAWLLSSFEKDIRNLAEGTYSYAGADAAAATPTPSADDLAASVFEIGSFNNPTMEGPEVDAPARTIEVNIGFWSIPKKDQAQNNLEVDFLMFTTSPEGYGLYLENRLDPNNPQGGVNGPPVIKNVSLPPEYAERFASLKLIGNTEKDTAGTYRARGVADYQPTVREWVDLAQQYFTDKITLDEFLDQYQAALENNFDAVLEHQQLTPTDLEDPTKKPANF
ncbi:MAG: carbohydrate ABC transporter substrate-binding protein [Caldilineaceae bacterium]|jgi:ABC-type glycerol-3-phosphate transport system substrate-binding protein|nr:carbohydrate ABC transporter substrate-binding protein [Caldilineaceae bacterium]